MSAPTLPLVVHGAGVFPYSTAHEGKLMREDAFGERYSLSMRHESELWVPRALCTYAQGSQIDQTCAGTPVWYDNRFVPRHDEQASIVTTGTRLLSEGKSFILEAPTGWGKTVVGCAIAATAQTRIVVITTKDDIVDQWVNSAISVLGLSKDEIGQWRGDSYPKPHHKFVVGLVQSIAKGPERYPNVDFRSFGLVMIDEVHRMGAEFFSQAMWWFPARLRLGLSATPIRKDGRSEVFKAHIGSVQLVAQQQTMIPKVIIQPTGWKVPPIPHEPGRTMQLLKPMADSRSRNEIIVNFVLSASAKGRSTIIFADTLYHLEKIRDALLRAQVPKSHIGYYVGLHGTDSVYSGSKAQRKLQREKAKLKPIILATYMMAAEATDIPWLDTCVLASPRSDVVQIVGRIRREYPDKKFPVVLDLVDSNSRVLSLYANKRLRWYRSLRFPLTFKA